MPTSRPRHLITETETVAAALDAAAEHWPQDRGRRSRLLLHLIEEGHRQLTEVQAEQRRLRLTSIQRTQGALSGVYQPGYLAQLRDDWAE